MEKDFPWPQKDNKKDWNKLGIGLTNNVNSFFNQNIYKYYAFFNFYSNFYPHTYISSYILKRHFKSNQVLLLIILHSVYCHSSDCKFRGHLSNNNIFLKKFYWQKQEINCTVTAKTIANKVTADWWWFYQLVICYGSFP